jgi:hypothetical protein
MEKTLRSPMFLIRVKMIMMMMMMMIIATTRIIKNIFDKFHVDE